MMTGTNARTSRFVFGLRLGASVSAAVLLVVALTDVAWSQGLGSGGGAAQAAVSGRGAAMPKKAPSEFDDLLRVVTTSVAPDTWADVGGAGTAVAVDTWGVMVVSQTEDVHELIANLISAIRRVRKQADGSAEPDPGAPVQSARVDGEASRTQHARIVAALDAQASAQFFEAPLEEFTSFLQRVHKIPVYLDEKALAESGKGSDTPVTCNLKGVSLRSLLHLVLTELDLTYVIKDEVLKITTPEAAENEMVTRVYSVKDLAVKRPQKRTTGSPNRP